ncbi:hypothetical protein UO65_4810 [Actinokineospora spheciospongiae]|uniref:Uncharacterized protein n=1 Tax=Actinokineospora spheciospongiae TaxID=909613 RepID=W7IGD3_9PSEU|nr:hypothetical protein UO65_4810 [Actinokineospora spheciospongiae]
MVGLRSGPPPTRAAGHRASGSRGGRLTKQYIHPPEQSLAGLVVFGVVG